MIWYERWCARAIRSVRVFFVVVLVVWLSIWAKLVVDRNNHPGEKLLPQFSQTHKASEYRIFSASFDELHRLEKWSFANKKENSVFFAGDVRRPLKFTDTYTFDHKSCSELKYNTNEYIFPVRKWMRNGFVRPMNMEKSGEKERKQKKRAKRNKSQIIWN